MSKRSVAAESIGTITSTEAKVVRTLLNRDNFADVPENEMTGMFEQLKAKGAQHSRRKPKVPHNARPPTPPRGPAPAQPPSQRDDRSAASLNDHGAGILAKLREETRADRPNGVRARSRTGEHPPVATLAHRAAAACSPRGEQRRGAGDAPAFRYTPPRHAPPPAPLPHPRASEHEAIFDRSLRQRQAVEAERQAQDLVDELQQYGQAPGGAGAYGGAPHGWSPYAHGPRAHPRNHSERGGGEYPYGHWGPGPRGAGRRVHQQPAMRPEDIEHENLNPTILAEKEELVDLLHHNAPRGPSQEPWSVHMSIHHLRASNDRTEAKRDERRKVEAMKVVMRFVVGVVANFLTKNNILRLEGFTDDVFDDMTKFDAAFVAIHQRHLRKKNFSPFVELGMLLVMPALTHHFGGGGGQRRNRRRFRRRTAAESDDETADAGATDAEQSARAEDTDGDEFGAPPAPRRPARQVRPFTQPKRGGGGSARTRRRGGGGVDPGSLLSAAMTLMGGRR